MSTASSGPILELVSSHRLTSSISLHVFSSPAGLPIFPTQHVVLQFPPELDPIGGSRSLSDEDRRLQFTPSRVTAHTGHEKSPDDAESFIEILTRNGRTTSLLGLPRMQPLKSELVGTGGGFPLELLNNSNSEQEIFAVAGGTGISCFLSLVPHYSDEFWSKVTRLIWTIRAEDFRIVEYVLERGLLDLKQCSVSIFVTAGDATDGLMADKSLSWWEEKLSTMGSQLGPAFKLQCGRMGKGNLSSEETGPDKPVILFCGGKSLQWQVKAWSLGKATVYSTDI